MGDNNGISGGLQITLPDAMTISAFTAIAWYNWLELNIMIWMTFKRHNGLYFYSLLASSWGIIIYALAFLMKFFQVWKNDYVSVALITVGWYAMVTGQSLVLYSRLHLVVRDLRKIRWILYMILTDIVLFHFPTTVMTFGVSVSQLFITLESLLIGLVGKLFYGESLYQSIFGYGKDSGHGVLHSRIYNLQPLCLRNISNAAT
jgi:hypothetical protein